MKTLIVYSSILGTTRRYARWLSEALEADITKANARRRSARDYDLIIICSPACMGRIRLMGYLKDRWSVLKDRKVILVAVGFESPASHAGRKGYSGIPPDILSRIAFFRLPGGIGPAGGRKVRPENLQPIIQYIRSVRG